MDEVKLASSDIVNRYIYRTKVSTLNCNVMPIHGIRNNHYEYKITIDKYNLFSKTQIETIFSNISFIIDIINKKLIRLFNNSDEIDDSFECKFDIKNKILTFLFDYQTDNSLDYYANDIVKLITDTLLDSAEELKNDNNIPKNLTLIY